MRIQLEDGAYEFVETTSPVTSAAPIDESKTIRCGAQGCRIFDWQRRFDELTDAPTNAGAADEIVLAGGYRFVNFLGGGVYETDLQARQWSRLGTGAVNDIDSKDDGTLLFVGKSFGLGSYRLDQGLRTINTGIAQPLDGTAVEADGTSIIFAYDKAGEGPGVRVWDEQQRTWVKGEPPRYLDGPLRISFFAYPKLATPGSRAPRTIAPRTVFARRRMRR